MRNKYNFINKVLLVILSIIILYYYSTILLILIRFLIENDDYSYGLIIPIVSIYIIYQKWPIIKQIVWNPSWWGVLIITGALCINIIGEVAADLYTIRISFIISLMGLLVLIGGWRLARLLLFPIFLLFLMIPLPSLITKALTIPLQLISSRLATGLLQMLGVVVLRQGNIIDLGVTQMQIVDACSGLRYILALVALGVIFCYFYQRKPWKIIILMIVLIPATIFANGVRVAAMGLYPILLSGFWHAFSGWLIFIFCFGFLAFVNYILDRIKPPQAEETALSKEITVEAVTGTGNSLTIWKHVLSAVVIILIFMPITRIASYTPNYPLKNGFENFPMKIGPWKGRHVYVNPEEVAATQAQAHLNVEYTSPEYGMVSLWIAYYETQKKAGGFVHSPKGCFLAHGWELEQAHTLDIGKGKTVNSMIANLMGNKILVNYWFMQRGRWLADETANKFYMAYDGFLKRRTDGAMVRLITPLGGNQETAQKRLTIFADELIPILSNFIPE